MTRVKDRIVIIIVFAIFFMSVGWLAPAFYAAYAPADHFVEQNSFEPADVSTLADEHHVCFNRTIHRASTGQVVTELYLVPVDNGTRVEVLSKDDERFFQKGQYVVTLDIELPKNLKPGEYRYRRVYKMELANGRVSRQFVFESEVFNVTEVQTTRNTTSCRALTG